jgi:hypothetical protein
VRAPGSATGTDRSRTGPQKAVDGWPVVEQGYRGWGVWFPDDPQRTPWHRFLDEAAAAGYTAVELGPYGYLPTHPEQLRAELGRRVAGVEVPGQRLGQRRNLDPHPALGQLRQRPRIPFPVDQRGQHRPHGDGGQARGDDRQLDGSVLEHQLQPHRLPGAVAHQLLPIAGQHPQPAIVCRRHERRAQQPVLEQLGDPLGTFSRRSCGRARPSCARRWAARPPAPPPGSRTAPSSRSRSTPSPRSSRPRPAASPASLPASASWS